MIRAREWRLAGPDYGHGLPRFPADARAARGFNGDIAQHAARWRDALAAGDEPGRLGRQLARKTLLAVAGLVSIHDATWTTDRALAAHRWAEIEPELGPALDALLAWSDGLVQPGRQAVQHMLDITTPRITEAFARTIGLWPAMSTDGTRLGVKDGRRERTLGRSARQRGRSPGRWRHDG